MPSGLKAALPGSLAFLTDASVRHRYNDEFVSAELSRYRRFFDDLDGRSLSDQQREACIRLEDNNLLVASAGSGKSATMVGKVDFTSGPVPNVSEAPIIGAQWVKSKAGSKYPFDLVIVDNAPDPNVPIAAKLLPYNS